ncbi:MAG: Zn-ribbon domain-containing OB-fold protein [Betaproteobacteria bacterium]|nr:Zn-ribbon domain-containing OB-fold protein [Betaproteobacteria bacterium]
MTMQRPLPVLDHLSRPFWEGCREHRLRLQKCGSCGKAQFPPGPICKHCRSSALDWITSSGHGTIYSWIVVRHPVPSDVYVKEVPYVVALVELDDGVRMPTNIVGCSPEAIGAGMEVEVSFVDINDTISLHRFQPVAQLHGKSA